MNTKLKTLIQALIDEVNEVKGVNDTKNSPDNWWKLIDWKEPEMRTAFDALSENTRKLIIDEGLCPDCPEKKDEFPKAPDKPGEEPPCEEKVKKEHPDWTPEQCAEECKKAEEDKKKEPPKEEKKESELTPEEKKKKEEEEVKRLEEEKKKKFPPKKDIKPLNPQEVLDRANRVMKK